MTAEMAKDIFKRLSAGRPPAAEGTTRQPPRSRIADRKAFLQDILTCGPAPAALIVERGRERGFTRMQLRYARWQLNITPFKGLGKNGGWFWVLPHDNRPAPRAASGVSRALSQ